MMIGGPKEEKGPAFAEEEATEEKPDMAKSASLSAAKDALAAFESGDAAALDSALRAHYEACSYSNK